MAGQSSASVATAAAMASVAVIPAATFSAAISATLLRYCFVSCVIMGEVVARDRTSHGLNLEAGNDDTAVKLDQLPVVLDEVANCLVLFLA